MMTTAFTPLSCRPVRKQHTARQMITLSRHNSVVVLCQTEDTVRRPRPSSGAWLVVWWRKAETLADLTRPGMGSPPSTATVHWTSQHQHHTTSEYFITHQSLMRLKTILITWNKMLSFSYENSEEYWMNVIIIIIILKFLPLFYCKICCKTTYIDTSSAAFTALIYSFVVKV